MKIFTGSFLLKNLNKQSEIGMYITVRTFDGKQQLNIRDVSKCMLVEELRGRLVDHFSAPLECQRLFYRGKEMVDGQTLFHYGVQLNDTIQLMIKKVIAPVKPTTEVCLEPQPSNGVLTPVSSSSSLVSDETASEKSEEKLKDVDKTIEEVDSTGALYKPGDIIDVRDPMMGAWFEARVTARKPGDPTPIQTEDSDNKNGTEPDKENSENAIEEKVELTEVSHDDGWLYDVKFEGEGEQDTLEVSGRHIRPRSRKLVPLKSLTQGQQVMVNYNYDQKTERGYWYDAVVESVNVRQSSLLVTIFFGPRLLPLHKCKVMFVSEVMLPDALGTQLNVNNEGSAAAMASLPSRTIKPECDFCKDNPKRKCRECSCRVCGDKADWASQLLCDECDHPYHMACLSPPMTQLPPEDEDWYCPDCKNDNSQVVSAGQAPKESKKLSKMPSQTGNCKRDWGRGFACSGRTKVCSKVPANHFGPIPGVEVGQSWLYRVQVSEYGVHRPPVSGIHGRDNEGAYSIVLSGGYEDDLDNGDEFFYTGCGGRDLSGNRRTAEQSCDQVLTRMNRALARVCAVPINDKDGGDAGNDWKKGKPVRVLRNYKASKHSKYAPEKGNRYDGIYKVVKYWPEKGKSGFVVWRYLLRRDDASPAPWTPAGERRVAELGLEMELPEGYQEKMEAEENAEQTPGKSKKKEKKKDEKTPTTTGKKDRKRKVLAEDNQEEEDEEDFSDFKKRKLEAAEPQQKKVSIPVKYCLPEDTKGLIQADTQNTGLWKELFALLDGESCTRKQILDCVENLFCCLCCQDMVFAPVTTPCSHNLCLACIKRSFSANVLSCPYCRADLTELKSAKGGPESHVNANLQSALNAFFPGYSTGR